MPPQTGTQGDPLTTKPRDGTPQRRTHAPVYTVWAPRATDVALHIDGRNLPMRRGDGGWWRSDAPIEFGAKYGFVVNGEGPFPDPRSPFQPDGVHGLSQQIDHDAFGWTDLGWQAPPLASAVIYELHIGTFTPDGTFDSAIARLPHLVDLGVTHVEVMPIAQFSGTRGWGYDGVDLFAPHAAYGGPDAFKRFVDACHARRLAVILDVVYNHLGPSGNYLGKFGPYFTHRYKTPWGDAVNLDDDGSDEVRRLFLDNAAMWIRDYHVDGLRVDAVHAFVDNSALHFVAELAAHVKRLRGVLGRHLVLIVESDLNDPRVIEPPDCGGWGADAQWSDDFHHALHSLVTGERSGYYKDFGSLQHFTAALTDVFVYAGTRSEHRGRVHGRPISHADGWQFVVAAQNHDQVGNRARGDRLTQLTSDGRLKMVAAMLLTAPFVPLLFQGEEWAASSPFTYFTAHEDTELGEQVRLGRQREFAAFGWDPSEIPDPQAPDTFYRARLLWDELSHAHHAGMLEWYRELIALRRRTPDLRDGDYRACQVTYDERAQWIVIRRNRVAVVCNLSHSIAVIPLAGTSTVLLGSEPGIEHRNDSMRMPPESVAIVITSTSSFNL